MAQKYKMLKFTISGSYYNSKNEAFDFDRVEGVIPWCDEEKGIGSMHVRGRYAEKWVREAVDKKGNRLHPERIDRMCQVFIDNVEETTGELSFVGKDIKELSIDEMQDLATAKDIRFIPVPRSGMSLRDLRVRAYVGYAELVLKKKIKYQDEGFNFSKLPSIFLDASGRIDNAQKVTNDEIIDNELVTKPLGLGERDDPRNRFTLAELKELADSKNIDYPEDLSDDELFSELYAKLYGGSSVAA